MAADDDTTLFTGTEYPMFVRCAFHQPFMLGPMFPALPAPFKAFRKNNEVAPVATKSVLNTVLK